MNRFPDAPANIGLLPTDARGFPVPWFIDWIDGKPDFRVADRRKQVIAVKKHRCWICGQKIGRMKSFVVGPMCGLNRISSEPPSHPLCAVFAAQACPFLSHPLAKRPPSDDLTDKGAAMPGMPLLHNPGVTLIWSCLRYRVVPGHPGVLFEMGVPEWTRWFREGREATRTEILEAIAKGLPALKAAAAEDGPEAEAEVSKRLRELMQLLPA